MRKRHRPRLQNIIICAVVVISIVLVGASVALLAKYSNVMHDGAGVVGMIRANEASDSFCSAIDSYRSLSDSFAKALLAESYSDVDGFALAISRQAKDPQFAGIMFARYFKDGMEYNIGGAVFDPTMESKQVTVGSRMGVTFCAGVVADRQYSISAVAYCVPLKNCPYADCLALFYPTDSLLEAVQTTQDENLSSQLATVCTNEGEVISILQKRDFDIQKHNNIYEFLRSRINDKSTIDQMQQLISEGRSQSYSVTISGQEYVLAVSGIHEHGTSPFSVIAIYKANDIYNAAYSTVSTVLGLLAIFFVMLIFASVYFFASSRASEKRLQTVNDYNDLLDCPTRVKFEHTVEEILRQHKGSLFAIVVVDIRHFDYLTEHTGYEQMMDEVRRMRDYYTRFLQVQETFGYAGNGRFLLLMHYRDEEALGQRIRALSAYLESSHLTSSGERITLAPYGGIYLVKRTGELSAERMVDKAISAENATKYPFDFESFRLYNEKLHSSNEMAEYIEINMQSALDNHLFKVFYQPKFNLKNAVPDGCEALVRWYNPETDEYMQPGIFLPLFEENRFIVKLDHYVYEQVCIYITETVKKRQALYPISVNVSRITASEPDFLDTYISIKKKYGIADNFLTIEFTESFAFEDYERLRETVSVLHQNGFQCSIDDFGSGFSSYNILKELPMDEIKLDRFFILKGFSDERDLKVLSSVIQLGHNLNMKVTQEGVETKDQLLMLKKLGCNVIQGYFYSKPLVQGDYDDFLVRKIII